MLKMPTIACNRPVTSLAPYVIRTHERNQEANACIWGVIVVALFPQLATAKVRLSCCHPKGILRS